jgi:hypothetical protein
MYNFIFRWKYDEFVATLGGKVDFRTPASDTTCKMVLTAIAFTTQWMITLNALLQHG